MPPKFVRQAAYKRARVAMTAKTGALNPRRAALTGSNTLVIMGPMAEKNHMAAESAVTAARAVPNAPAICRIACPTFVSAAARKMSTKPPSTLAAPPMAGKKALPTAMARLVSLFESSCRAFSVVLLRTSNSFCMEPA